MKLLDTSFLIDLHREWAKTGMGPAMRFLHSNDTEQMGVSTISRLEFLEDFTRTGEGELFLAPFISLDVTHQTARIGSRIRQGLRKDGMMIGDFDILIAATALEHGIVLVTGDTGHYHRIRDLELEAYRELEA